VKAAKTMKGCTRTIADKAALKRRTPIAGGSLSLPTSVSKAGARGSFSAFPPPLLPYSPAVPFNTPTPQFVTRLLLIFCLAWVLVATLLEAHRPEAGWPCVVLVVLAAASALASLHQSLQFQNVAAAAIGMFGILSVTLWLNSTLSIPFGPQVFTDSCGPQLIEGLPLIPPLLWLAVILTVRGTARLILRPWRKLRTYGFRLMGLTCLLVAAFDAGLEPFASRVNHFWIWEPTAVASTWYGAPWINFFGWLVITLLLLAVITPWLINKQPVRKRPADFHPLWLWLGLNLFLAWQLATHHLWAAGIVVGGHTAITTLVAWKNGRW